MRLESKKLIAAALLANLPVTGWAAPVKKASPARVEKLAGGWTIARLDEWPDTCALRLTKLTTIGGYATVLGRGCTKAFAAHDKARSWTDDVFAWRPTEKGVTLADATRHTLITFVVTAMGTGGQAWIGHGPDGQDYEIIRDAKKTRSPVKSDQ